MTRFRENEKQINTIFECAMNNANGTYESGMVTSLCAIAGILAEISKSLAIITDSIKEKG